MSGFSYHLAPDDLPTLGLVVLSVDETIEQDFRRVFPANRAKLHVTRVPSGAELGPASIAAMAGDLPAALALLPKAARFGSVAYACTSGTAQIGAERVHEMVRAAVATEAVTDPLTAALAAFEALGLRRVGVVSPYVRPVADRLIAALGAKGVVVPESLSFGEAVEANVARIAPASIAEAARGLARTAALDGVFLSCTNLRTFGIIAALEAELGLPVLSSNQVLAWHMARQAGIDPDGLPGKLAGL